MKKKILVLAVLLIGILVPLVASDMWISIGGAYKWYGAGASIHADYTDVYDGNYSDDTFDYETNSQIKVGGKVAGIDGSVMYFFQKSNIGLNVAASYFMDNKLDISYEMTTTHPLYENKLTELWADVLSPMLNQLFSIDSSQTLYVGPVYKANISKKVQLYGSVGVTKTEYAVTTSPFYLIYVMDYVNAYQNYLGQLSWHENFGGTDPGEFQPPEHVESELDSLGVNAKLTSWGVGAELGLKVDVSDIFFIRGGARVTASTNPVVSLLNLVYYEPSDAIMYEITPYLMAGVSF